MRGLDRRQHQFVQPRAFAAQHVQRRLGRAAGRGDLADQLVRLLVRLVQQPGRRDQCAARQIARVLSSGTGSPDAVLAAVAGEYGIDAAALRVELSCQPVANPCPAPGSFVTVRVSTDAVLPLAPDVLNLAQVTAIPLESVLVHRMPGSH